MGIKITKLQLILIGVLLCMFLAMNIYYTIKINSINDINQQLRTQMNALIMSKYNQIQSDIDSKMQNIDSVKLQIDTINQKLGKMGRPSFIVLSDSMLGVQAQINFIQRYFNK